MNENLIVATILAATHFLSAGENTIVNIREDVRNESDGSSSINSGLDLGGVELLQGNGIISDERRRLDEFNSISIRGSFDVSIKAGSDSNEILMRMDSNILPLVESKIEDGILQILPSKPCSFTKKPALEISCRKISELKSSGGNSIRIHGLDSETFRASSSGREILDLEGRTAKMELSTSGSCMLDATKLSCDAIDVKATGSGELHLDAQNSLSAEIRGSTSIFLPSRPPEMTEKISGSGKIIFEK